MGEPEVQCVVLFFYMLKKFIVKKFEKEYPNPNNNRRNKSSCDIKIKNTK